MKKFFMPPISRLEHLGQSTVSSLRDRDRGHLPVLRRAWAPPPIAALPPA
jgi:hypothetical protein